MRERITRCPSRPANQTAQNHQSSTNRGLRRDPLEDREKSLRHSKLLIFLKKDFFYFESVFYFRTSYHKLIKYLKIIPEPWI